MDTPTREEFIQRAVRWAEIHAGVKWDMEYGDPARAREMAGAWVSVIELMVMTSSADYARASWSPYQAPQCAVVPAAPGISLRELGFSIRYLPAGSPFRFDQGHEDEVRSLFNDLTISEVPQQRYTRETVFPEDRVLITWHTECAPLTSDPRDPIPFNVFLLSPDGKERETSRVSTRIVAAFPTEEAATQWVRSRAGDLQAQHDRNHTRLCKDTACANRRHIYVPHHD